MLYTTLAKLHEVSDCQDTFKLLATQLGGIEAYGVDTLIPLDKILDLLGLEDALCCLQATTKNEDALNRVLVCDYAERVLPIFEQKYPGDKRPRQAIEVSRLYARGQASQQELLDAFVDAHAAASTYADVAYAAAPSATYAAVVSAAARDAAYAASSAPSYKVASFTVHAANFAVCAVGFAALADGDAASVAAQANERKWQTQHFIEMIKGD